MTETPNQGFRMPATDTQRYIEQAGAFMQSGRFQEAVLLYESALNTLERMYGGDVPELAECLQDLGDAYEAAYRLTDALAIHTRLLRLGERVLGKTNPNVVAMLFKLTQLNEMLGRPADALVFCQQALESARECLVQDDPLSQQIIMRYRYLTTLAQTQAQMQNGANTFEQPPSVAELQSQMMVDVQPQSAAVPELKPAVLAGMLDQLPLQTTEQRPEEIHSELVYEAGPQPLSQMQSDMLAYMKAKEETNGETTLPPSEAAGPGLGRSTNMQDFAREMLRDMPSSQMAFGQNEASLLASGDSDGPLGSPIPPAPAPDMEISVPFNLAPNAVSSKIANQNKEYKAILEAGFSAAQNHSSQTGSYPYGSSGSATNGPGAASTSPIANANAAAGFQTMDVPDNTDQGYSINDLNEIRSGRRAAEELANATAPGRPRRMTSEDNARIRAGRMAKDFALPAFFLVAVIGLITFFVISHKDNGKASDAGAAAKAAANSIYRTSDGEKEVRLMGGNEAVLVTAGNGILVPFSQITGSVGDLFSAMSSSLFEKQIWAEKKDYGLKTQDEIVYYTKDGAESKVITKMRELAGYAQAYYIKQGEYPKFVTSNMMNEFAFVSPLDGRGIPIQIKTLVSQVPEFTDVTGGLEAGLEVGLVQDTNNDSAGLGNAPCGITCYAVADGKTEDKIDALRASKFFVRGCDRNGTFLASSHSGRTFVLPASDAMLAAVPSSAVNSISSKATAASKSRAARARSKNKTKAAVKSAADGSADANNDDQDKTKSNQGAPGAVKAAEPDKNTKLWIVDNPTLPMVIMHHALPLLLIGLSLAIFIVARMLHIEATGSAISTTSNARSHYTKIAAAVVLAIAFVTLLVQFIVFY